jgi:3-oxoadipate enol-lactonase
MAIVSVNDIEMYYEIHGEGEPVVLIAGLNSDHSFYQRAGLIDRLAERYQVIVFDNRGVGQTSKPDIPYSIEMMADDTAGLLKALSIEQAHILGISLGGRIAVTLALRHPQLVKSLILVSTIMNMKKVQNSRARRRIRFMLSIPAIRGSNASIRQFEASTDFDCTDRLGEIHVPTLILHGKQDRTAPHALAEEMHEGIQHSQMITFQGGHIFFALRQKQFIDAIVDFLDSLRRHAERNETA